MSKLISSLLAISILTCASVFAAGSRSAFKNEVTITVENGVRIIRSNGIPNHETGQFPNRDNPNTIAPQKYEFRVPADPKAAAKTTPLRMQPFGVAINGIVFDPGAAEWWNRDRESGWQYEPLAGNGMLGVDHSHAHVQPSGAYHYHGLPTALIYALTDGKDKTVLVGWAADGFPIYNPLAAARNGKLQALKSSYQIKKGTRPNGPGGAYDGTFVADYEYIAGSGDLDECNGLASPTPEYPQGIYHYVLTETFPFVPRLYRGTPDKSFNTHGPGGGGPGTGGALGAQRGGGGLAGPRGGGQRPPLPLIIQALDANGDGIIDADEIKNAVEVLKKLDKNGDGRLTPDEYLGPRPGGGGNGGPPAGGPGGGEPRGPRPDNGPNRPPE